MQWLARQLNPKGVIRRDLYQNQLYEWRIHVADG